MFSSVFRDAVACGLAKAICNNFVFPRWAYAAGFNRNNNNLFNYIVNIDIFDILITTSLL